MKRVIIVVMDSAGIGELPDAANYGDVGSNTIGNISRHMKNFKLPNMEKMGIGNIERINGVPVQDKPNACYGKMREMSLGKDTTTGHWEMSGIILEKPFPVYPNGFPAEIIKQFEISIGREVMANEVASGTEIINRLGEEHMKTGRPIVYTSADSVFQIAAHESIIPIEKLYEMCEKARNMLTGGHAVGRVIARPFEGEPGNFKRTSRRRDFSLDPLGKTVLDYAAEKGYEVKAVGKIEDIFNKKGITEAVHTVDNMDGVDKTLEYMKTDFEGILFTNLVDFDMKYGHRNDIEGYGNALMEFDSRIPEVLELLKDEDILIITADHGCDPTTPSTDHSREYVPLLVYGNKLKKGINLGIRNTFADLAATAGEYLQLGADFKGESFLKEIL